MSLQGTEVLFDQLPEPIDLELDVANRVLYWTDRGDPPGGNTVKHPYRPNVRYWRKPHFS